MNYPFDSIYKQSLILFIVNTTGHSLIPIYTLIYLLSIKCSNCILLSCQERSVHIRTHASAYNWNLF